jgi:hypothetical protein
VTPGCRGVVTAPFEFATTVRTRLIGNLPAINEHRQQALDALDKLQGSSPWDQLTPVWALVHRWEVKDHLAILDWDGATLACPKERETARRAAAEIRSRTGYAPPG